MKVTQRLGHCKPPLWIGQLVAARGGTLCPREIEAMRYYVNGYYPKKFGPLMGITTNTAQVHLQRAKIKLGARSLVQAAVLFDRQLREI